MHFFLKISSLKISPYALSRILGILLDNAIEAASTSPEKRINFEIVPAPGYNSPKPVHNKKQRLFQTSSRNILALLVKYHP